MQVIIQAAAKKQVAHLIIRNNIEDFSGNCSPDQLKYFKAELQPGSLEIQSNASSKTGFLYLDDTVTAEKQRIAGYNFAKALNFEKHTEVSIDGNGEEALNVAEGIALSAYSFQKYKSKKGKTLKTISIDGEIQEEKLSFLNAKIEGTYITRNLVNEHSGYQTPLQLSADIDTLAKKHGFRFEKLEMAQIQSLKMGGLLAVNKASSEEPTFNILEWKPKNASNKKPIVLVGKGVVYDTGGLSLKPTPHAMDFMKADMAGAGAVVGAICAIAQAQLDKHVIGLIAATDNRIGADAYSPGDVIKMYNGKTVEVLNTDAEGRLTLADALTYADKFEPEIVVDIATLTGAAARAIGVEGSVYMGNASRSIMEALKTAGDAVHERLVEFPLWEEYNDQLKSDIADLTNLGGDTGGAITAGMFLQNFTKAPWVHIDIAGPSFLHQEDHYRGKNGTGVGVRLFFDWITNF